MSDGGRRRARSPRWLRSVRRRPAAFVALVVISALAVAVSVLTPMLLRAVQADSLVHDLATADVFARSVTATATADDSTLLGDAVYASDQITSAFGGTRLWTPSTEVITTSDIETWQPGGRTGAERSYFTVTQDRTCAGIPVVSGTCPVGGSEALLPAPTARRLKLKAGSFIDLGQNPAEATEIEVVGTYDPARGYGRVLAAPDALIGTPLTTSSGSVLLGTGHVESLHLTFSAYSSVSLRQPLRIADVPEARSDVVRMEDGTLNLDSAQTSASVRTGLLAELDHIDLQQSAAATLTTATALEALALSWFALGYLIQRISRVRATEWGIGRTRGVKRRTWLATVFLEPFVALVVGAAAGFPIGVLAARVIADLALGPGVPVEPFQPVVLAAAALALAGSLVALVAASVRSARLPLPALLRETTEPRRLSRLALVAQVGVVLVTVTVVVAVLTQPTISGPQVALLTPSLVALVVGIGALRLTVVLVRRATARPPRSLGGLVVGRQLARAPSTLSGAVMVAVGLALAAYLLSLQLVGERLEDARADAGVGASTVLHVVAPAGSSLVDLVRRADPSGRTALAAREVSGAGLSGTDRVLAVDAPRLAAITTWRSAWWGGDPAVLTRELDPATGTPLTFRGTRLMVTLANLGPSAAVPMASDGEVRMQAEIATQTGWRTVDLGLVRDGTLTSSRGSVPCTAGCRLISLSVLDPNSTTTGPFGLAVDLAAIATDRQPASRFAVWLKRSHPWRQRIADQVDPTFPAFARADSRGTGLRIEFDANVGGVEPEVEPAVGSAVLPALVARGTGAQRFPGIAHGVFGSDLQRGPLLLQTVASPAVLPRIGDEGVLVDLTQLARLSDTSAGESTDEVWLTPGAHSGVLATLRAEGVRVQSTETLAAARAEDEREAPVRSLALTTATAAAALLLTLLALVAARAVGGAARRRDVTTLRVAGVPSRAMRRLGAAEFAVPTAAGAVLGVLAGVGAYLLTVQRLPLLAGDGITPPPDLLPPIAALAVLVVVGVLVAVLVGLAAGRAEIRSAP